MKHEERKIKAIELLKQLDIYKPYIEGFKEKDQVCFFERFGGYWVDQEPEVYNKMKEVEERFNCTVYAITHEYTEFGECYSFLLVTRYKQEWKNLVVSENGTHYAFAYVWNKDDDWCSELGTIGVKSFGGGITRVS
ncbi:MAG: hypothetical protein J6W28_06040 [Clostridia bacterium]|nr:hypothetical protein [Clostridia bacterium]